MITKEEKYYQDQCNEYSDRITEAQWTISKNIPTAEKAEEVLDFHLEQLRKRGANLEDSVCELLRDVLEIARAKEELTELRKAYRENKEKLDNIRNGL